MEKALRENTGVEICSQKGGDRQLTGKGAEECTTKRVLAKFIPRISGKSIEMLGANMEDSPTTEEADFEDYPGKSFGMTTGVSEAASGSDEDPKIHSETRNRVSGDGGQAVVVDI